MQLAKCDSCGETYKDEESVELIKKWKSEGDGYAPCPNISCHGQMEIQEEELAQNK